MYKTVFAALLLLQVSVSKSQSLYPEVLNSSGELFSQNGYSVSWTLGETAIGFYSNQTNIVSEGFQQPEIIISSIMEYGSPETVITVYPNPSTTELFISLKNPQIDGFVYRISDLNGKILLSGILSRSTNSIDLADLPAGIFYLSVENYSTKTIRSFKIVKIN